MKYILLIIAVIITTMACQNKEDNLGNVPVIPVYNNSALSDTAKTGETMEPQFAGRPKRVAVKHTVHTAMHRTRTSETIYQPPVETSPVLTPAPASTGVNTIPSSTGAGTNTGTGTTSTIPQPEKKKGWNKATKGAVIGGVAGAIGGAIISKKKGLGAVIGGAIGVAGGYAIGKKMDKKDNPLITH